MENEIPQSVIDLIIEKDFQELSPDEKTAVLNNITEPEYQWYRQTMTRAQEAERMIAPQLAADPLEKARLLANAYPQKNSVGYRIPIWQAAAAILILCGLTWVLAGNRTSIKTVVQRMEVEKPVIRVMHDTIIKPQIQTRYVTKVITRTTAPKAETAVAKIPSPDANLHTYSISDQNQKGGNSIVLDSNANMFGFVRL